MAYEQPTFAPPFRVLLLVAATVGWYGAPGAEARDRVLERFAAWLRGWHEAGGRLIASFDDDFFVVGQPASLPYSIYVLYEVDALDIVVARLAALREEEEGVRLDSAFRVEARVGRGLFLLER